jgi:SAM-dependent methyltransferase
MTEKPVSSEVKQDVRQFYDQIGWSRVADKDHPGEDVSELPFRYQNAHYEDLRPVAREYIHRCHLRVRRHLGHQGRLLLDAGSGPIQYPEYLEYSRGYNFRVCADISITALQEARKRIGERGLYVVADIANLPFMPGAFDGAVSLHTIHHLPEAEHIQAYAEIYRTLADKCSAVVVNGWPSAPLMRFFEPAIRLKKRVRSALQHRWFSTGSSGQPTAAKTGERVRLNRDKAARKKGKGTFTHRHDVAWVKHKVGAQMPVEILVWRSVSVRFLRTFIQPWLGGRYWLRALYWLEERYPHYFGENGQYPLIVIRKP